MAVVQLRPEASSEGQDNTVKSREHIESTHTSELVIALCGPIGSPIHPVAESIKSTLTSTFNYDHCEIIRLSKIIEKYKGKAPERPQVDRINYLIQKGDELRKDHGSSVLAEVAVYEIAMERERRHAQTDSERIMPQRVCHIIDSIKNQEELELLRLIYRDMLYVIGIYSPLPSRISALETSGMSHGEIHNLIDTDSGEEFSHGQTVRDTFPQSDIFLRINNYNESEIKTKVERFLHLILGSKVITPTSAETAMYAAASASGNSACLSRQVGASIVDQDGQIVSVGWNDVPRFAGGLYGGDTPEASDHRCWNSEGGMCFNDREKKNIASMLVSALVSDGVISEASADAAERSIQGNSKLKGLIEFSRSVHAEMHAIVNAAHAGGRMRRSKMFVTTYPCHNCARHIVAAGIEEVYYIEPYRKSLATRLHKDAITEDESANDKVRILPFDGVAPARYLKLFRIPPDSRKHDGKLIRVEPKIAEPRFPKTLEALPALEGIVVTSLEKKNLITGSGGNEAPK